jgi:hypothetical protein
MNRLILAAIVLGAALSFPSTSFALGNYKFCGRWTYHFDDQGQGEDFLLHEAGNSVGRINAARTWAVVERNGVNVWSGYMDTSGCTGNITANAGNYVFFVTTALAKSNKFIWIWPESNEQWQWFSATYNNQPQRATGNNVTHTTSFGTGERTASVAAVATHLLNQADQGLVDNTYKIYANPPCPGGSGACYDFSAVFLGTDNFGKSNAFKKSVIGHEVGHNVADKLFGSIGFSYSQDGGPAFPMCSCEHVTTSNKQHCLQSREFMAAAQTEGFGHFFATDLFNNGSQSDGMFAYYKEVNLFGTSLPPPVQVNVTVGSKWMATFCMPPMFEAGKGTEIDWLAFYWQLNNRTSSAFTYTNFRDVYQLACGGAGTNCTSSDNPEWLPLSIAVGTLYGSTSAKTQHWNTTADANGVIHL